MNQDGFSGGSGGEGEPKSVNDLSHRIIKKIGTIDPNEFKSSDIKEIDLHSVKKQRSEKWYVNTDNNTGRLRISRNL